MPLFRKIASFSGKELVLLPKMAILIAGIRIGLIIFPFSKVQNLLSRSSKRLSHPNRESSYPDQVVRVARAVARRTLRDKPCLLQALAVQWFLERAGYATTLDIGVVKEEKGQLRAHAWLKYNGDIIIGGRTSPSRYATLKSVQESGEAIKGFSNQQDVPAS